MALGGLVEMGFAGRIEEEEEVRRGGCRIRDGMRMIGVLESSVLAGERRNGDVDVKTREKRWRAAIGILGNSQPTR